jgi:solute carrier family 25 protein 16
MQNIYRSDGTRGLFRGHSATLLRIFPYAGIKFLAYEQVRAVMIHEPSQETAARRFLSGSIAGTVSVFFTYPLEVIRVRLAFETKSGGRISLAGICRQIYHEHPPRVSAAPLATAESGAAAVAAASAVKTIQELSPTSGMANFYRGFTPTLWGMLPYAGASFLTHDTMGDILRHPRFASHTTLPNTATTKKPAQLTTWAQLVAGGFAGFVSQTLSYPLEVVRRRMQVGGVVGDGRRQGIMQTARGIWLERGWKGFFVGLGIGYVKVVPMVATSFYVYERSKFWFGI